MTTKTITISRIDDISAVLQNSSDLTQLDRHASLILRADGTGQSIRIENRLGDYQIGIVDSQNNHVSAPGFKVPLAPEARIEFGDDSMAGTAESKVTLIPAAISWIGYGGYYRSQAAPGMVAWAAETAEVIAAIVSDPEGIAAVEAVNDAVERVNEYRAGRIKYRELINDAQAAALSWQREVAPDMDADNIKVRLSTRTGRVFHSNLGDVRRGVSYLDSDSLLLEAQLKPRGRWQTVLDRTAA
jgi:hypothetical protein